jgi:hypothetical protein
MVEEYLKQLIQEHLSGLKRTPSGWLKHNCPLCPHRGHSPDHKERFGILYSIDGAIALNCFNCGFSTNWRPGLLLGKKMSFFLSTIGVPQQDVDKLKFESFREQHNVVNPKITLTGNITNKWKPIEILSELPDCYSIRFWANNECEDEDFLEVVNYLVGRNILDIDRMYWTPHREFMYHRRVVVPFTYKGHVVGWTGRIITASKDIPKYHNNMPPSFIMGLDEQQDYDRKYHIISEGVFDAVVSSGVGVLHNKINDDQAALISNLHGEKILVPDRDSSGDELVQIAIDNKWSVSFPNWGRDSDGKIIKDIADAANAYGYVLALQSIVEGVERDAYAIKVKRKMDKVNYGY